MAKNAEFKAKRLSEIGDIKANVGCLLCGEKTPCCLDFHHLDPDKKDFGISHGYTLAWDKILLEMSKCIVLCKNCHAKVHNGLVDLSGISSTVE